MKNAWTCPSSPLPHTATCHHGPSSSRYNNLDERLDVVERQLLDMARDALEATQESAESTRGEF